LICIKIPDTEKAADMTPHHSNVRDMVFDLLELLDRRSAHGQDAFAEMDADGDQAIPQGVNVVPQVAGSDVGSARTRAVSQPEDPEVQARPGAEGVTP
jgi:hypothetical protein